jgi:heme-degrading monooxygenase HmoA
MIASTFVLSKGADHVFLLLFKKKDGIWSISVDGYHGVALIESFDIAVVVVVVVWKKLFYKKYF